MSPADAPLPDADAQVRFSMNKSGLKVGISRYTPPTGRGAELTPESLLRQLRAAGIVADMDMEAARKACDLLGRGYSVEGLAVARGVAAVEPRDASVEFAGDPDFPVLPGMRIGRVSPPVPGAKGVTADGRPLPPANDRPPANLVLGENVAAQEEVLTATALGLVRLENGEVRVEPLARVSEDAIQVTALIHHRDFLGAPLTPAVLEEELKRLGVVIKSRAMAIQNALAKAAETKSAQEVVAAKGTPPTPGRDGQLEILLKVRESGPVEKDGRIDYGERGSFPSVEPGMIVARLHPPTKGLPGMDVFGRPHPAREGRAVEVQTGENVEAEPDGITYKSLAEGMLVFDRNVLMVTDCLEVRRDVSFATGNIRVDKGSVRIRGAVSTGFTVEAPGFVVVEDVIESADVTAGGDVHVRGGLLMPGGGVVRAGGRVVAQYAINARIEAKGDVIIANEVSNSRIVTGGRFIAVKGTGVVQGCEIVSHAGVHVNELGSAIGAHTMVTISAKDTEHTDLLKEKSRLRRRVRRVNELLGTSDVKTILTKAPVAKRQAVAEILKSRIRDQARLEEIAAVLAEEREQRLSALEAAKVTVAGAVYPGVVIKFGGRVLKIADSISQATFSFERDGRGVTVRSS
jgi:uncharacterized protein (DUF342 family)